MTQSKEVKKQAVVVLCFSRLEALPLTWLRNKPQAPYLYLHILPSREDPEEELLIPVSISYDPGPKVT